jgi:hypothetical protein
LITLGPTIESGQAPTDRLWEMVDVVDVLDAFEAKRKRAAKPIFEAVQRAIGDGWYVPARSCLIAQLIE